MAVVIVVSDDSNRDGMQSTNRNVTRCILAIVVDADEKQWD